MTKKECVRRARNLNHQAMADMQGNKLYRALMCRNRRDEFMRLAREAS